MAGSDKNGRGFSRQTGVLRQEIDISGVMKYFVLLFRAQTFQQVVIARVKPLQRSPAFSTMLWSGRSVVNKIVQADSR